MAIYGSRSAYGYASGIVIGGFLCLGVCLLVVAGTFVLSLISLYIPNHSEEVYGDHYQMKSLMIKALYQDISFEFNNGTVADSIAMSTLCSTEYRNKGATNFLGCIAQNFRAFGPYDTSTNSRRRRRASTANAGLYEIGEINIYYSTSCPNKADISKYASAVQLSNCVRSRLTACNSLTNSSSGFTEWHLLPGGFSQMIVDEQEIGYQMINVQNIFGVPFSTASSLADRLTLSNATKFNIQWGCQYIGPLSQDQIAIAFGAQSAMTTTLPTSTNVPFS